MKKPLRCLLKAVCLICVLATATSCWDSKELDTLAIVMGISMDAVPESDDIHVGFLLGTISAEKSGSGGTSSQKPSAILERDGESLLCAQSSVQLDTSRELFLDHNQVIIIGESLAKQGLKSYLDTFIRDPEIRMEVMMLISEGKAIDILKQKSVLEVSLANRLSRMMMLNQKTSSVFGTDLLHFVFDTIDTNTAATVPMISYVEDTLPNLVLTGLAVFDDDKMIGKLSVDQTVGYALAIGPVSHVDLPLKGDGGKAAVLIQKSNASIKPVFHEDGTLSMQVDITVYGSVLEQQGLIAKEGGRLMETIQKATEKAITKLISETFDQSQRLDADIYGFAAKIRDYHPKKWKAYQDKWSQVYPTVSLIVKPKVHIGSIGKAVQSIQSIEEEK